MLPAGRGLYRRHPAREMRNSMLVAVFAGFFPIWWFCQGWGVAALWAAMSA